MYTADRKSRKELLAPWLLSLLVLHYWKHGGLAYSMLVNVHTNLCLQPCQAMGQRLGAGWLLARLLRHHRGLRHAYANLKSLITYLCVRTQY